MKRLLGCLLSLLIAITGIVSIKALDLRDPDQAVSLTLTHKIPFPLRIYYAATLEEDDSLTLTDSFEGCEVDLTSEDYATIANTLSNYITDDIKPDYTGRITDGSLKLSDLKQGLYVVEGDKVVRDDYIYSVVPFVVSLPNNIDDKWTYDITVEVKYEKITNPAKDYKVLKLWEKDTSSTRPKSIKVDLICNNKVIKTITLNESNNWSYAWKDDSGKGTWKVRESNVPNGYTMTVTQAENQFVITNKKKSPPKKTKTGDTLFKSWPIYVMIAAVIVLVGMFVASKKGKNE